MQDTLELLEASIILTDHQKAWWKTRLPKMNDVQRTEFSDILKEERMEANKMLKEKLRIKKIFHQKKLRSIYAYAEAKMREEEALELENLEQAYQSINA